MDALAEKEGAGAGVIKLEPVVALDGLHMGTELSKGVGDEVRERAESVRFNTKRKSPQIMRAIVKNDQIIFITRHTATGDVQRSQGIRSNLLDAREADA